MNRFVSPKVKNREKKSNEIQLKSTKNSTIEEVMRLKIIDLNNSSKSKESEIVQGSSCLIEEIEWTTVNANHNKKTRVEMSPLRLG